MVDLRRGVRWPCRHLAAADLHGRRVTQRARYPHARLCIRRDTEVTTPLLQLDGLSIGFGDKTVVRDLNLSIGRGERVALVGESGSGKSVTALSILGLADNARQTGRILLDGDDLLQKSEQQMRGIRGRDVAMVFQEPMTALNPLFTIGKQIAESLRLHEGLRPNAARQRGIELLRRTGIPEPERRIDSFPHQLYGGQRQRAMIAMALACRPRLLLADEPTTALDVTVRQQIVELLIGLQEQEAAERGMAVLLITHDLNLVKRFAQRVAVMEKGVLVETNSTAELFANPQHPYTRRLLNSEPERAIDPIASNAGSLLEVQGLSVDYRTSVRLAIPVFEVFVPRFGGYRHYVETRRNARRSGRIWIRKVHACRRYPGPATADGRIDSDRRTVFVHAQERELAADDVVAAASGISGSLRIVVAAHDDRADCGRRDCFASARGGCGGAS